MKKLFLLFVFCALPCFGQGVFIPPQTAFKVVNGMTSPIANATITVCAANASGIPCSPALVNTIFKDSGLNEPLSNPFTADSTGNYQFAAAPGNYTVTVTATGFSGYSYQITLAGGAGSLALKTNGSLNGSQSILDLKNGTGVAITDDGTGGVTVANSQMNLALSSPITDPTTGLTFTLKELQRPIEISPTSRDLILFQDSFTQNFGQYTFAGTTGTNTFTGGQLVTTSGAGGLNQYATVQRELEAASFTTILNVGTPMSGGTFQVVSTGIAKPASPTQNFVQCAWDLVNNQIRIESGVSGTVKTLAPVSLTGTTSPFQLGCVFTQDYVEAWVNFGHAWVFETGSQITDYDLLTPATLAAFMPHFALISPGVSTWKVNSFQVSTGSYVGLHDFNVVTYKDGSPYIRDGFMYFTATTSMVLTGNTVATSTWGVFRMALKGDNAVERVGIIWNSRDGKVYNDGPGQLVFDPDINAWRIIVATWGNNFGGVLEQMYGLYYGDPLHGLTVLSNLSVLNVTYQTGSNGTYDPSFLYDAARGHWYLSYAVTADTTFPTCSMYVAQDRTDDFVTFTAVGVDTTPCHEGPKMQRVGGHIYTATAGQTNFRVYDSDFNFIGNLNCPVPFTSGGAPPHPAWFPYTDGQITKFRLLTFDDVKYPGGGSFSWGNLRIYEAAESEGGTEYPYSAAPWF